MVSIYAYLSLNLFSTVTCGCYLQVVTAEDGLRLLVPVDRKLCLRVLRILLERSSAKTTITDFEAAFQHYYKESCTRHTLETRLSDIVKVTLYLFGYRKQYK